MAKKFDKLVEDSLDLFNNPTYSDLIVKCKRDKWYCHRAILCPRCPFFEAACKHPCEESEHQEITLEEDEPTAVKTMLRYLYSSGARDISIRNFNPASAIFVIADKYGLEDLKQRAKTIMLHGAEHPFSSIVEDVDVTSWAHSIEKVWSWTIEGSDDIRQAILKGFFNVPVKRYIENSAMNDLLSSHETFRTQLIVTLAGKHGS